MLEAARMAKKVRSVRKDQRASTGGDDSRVVEVRLTVSEAEAYSLGRVSRWEKRSEGISLELTGRS
jgi:hypothetical protein